jgi:hypothetical protein
MGRSRYTITETEKPHFLTCTIVEWLPLFTRPALVDIVLNTWRFQQANQGLQLYGYVVLENHLHYLAQSPDIAKSEAGIKFYIAQKHLMPVNTQAFLKKINITSPNLTNFPPEGHSCLSSAQQR